MLSGTAPFGFKGAGFDFDAQPLTRSYGQGDLHFITFSCYRRGPFLGTRRARNIFLKILEQVRRRHAFRLIGFVLMPKHVHLLISEPKKGSPSVVLQVLKQKTSRALCEKRRGTTAAQLRMNFGATSPGDTHFWQRRFYDFNVWSEKKLEEKLDYMHANPVKRKLVTHPGDWPWSSWSHYEGRTEGLIRMDTVEVTRVVGGHADKARQKPHP